MLTKSSVIGYRENRQPEISSVVPLPFQGRSSRLQLQQAGVPVVVLVIVVLVVFSILQLPFSGAFRFQGNSGNDQVPPGQRPEKDTKKDAFSPGKKHPLITCNCQNNNRPRRNAL